MQLHCKQVPIHCVTNKGEAAKLKLLHAKPFVSYGVFVFACAAVHESLLTSFSSINQSVSQSVRILYCMSAVWNFSSQVNLFLGSPESKVQEDVHFVMSNYLANILVTLMQSDYCFKISWLVSSDRKTVHKG